MLDASGQPTVRGRASTERELLMDRLERLQDLKRRIDTSDLRERTRADAVQVAIDHVQAAIDALELASRGSDSLRSATERATTNVFLCGRRTT
jgi:hypothetical protein